MQRQFFESLICFGVFFSRKWRNQFEFVRLHQIHFSLLGLDPIEHLLQRVCLQKLAFCTSTICKPNYQTPKKLYYQIRIKKDLEIFHARTNMKLIGVTLLGFPYLRVYVNTYLAIGLPF
jgi:hypothetical protein